MSTARATAQRVLDDRLPRVQTKGLIAEAQDYPDAGITGFFVSMPHPDGKQVIVSYPCVRTHEATEETLGEAFDEGVRVVREKAEAAL
jgi:hypothetical protein